MKFFGDVGCRVITFWWRSGAGFLSPDQDPYPEIFYYPAWLISLSVEDISSFLD